MTKDLRHHQKPEEIPDLTKQAEESPGQDENLQYWGPDKSLDHIRRIYVKTNYKYFQKIFEKRDAQGALQIGGFSNGAFFLNFFWFFHRKMYLEGLLIMGGVLLLFGIGVSLELSDNTLRAMSAGIAGGLASLGKYLYWLAVNRQIARARVLFPTDPNRALEWLDETGGVNYWALVAGVIFFILVFYTAI